MSKKKTSVKKSAPVKKAPAKKKGKAVKKVRKDNGALVNFKLSKADRDLLTRKAKQFTKSNASDFIRASLRAFKPTRAQLAAFRD